MVDKRINSPVTIISRVNSDGDPTELAELYATEYDSQNNPVVWRARFKSRDTNNCTVRGYFIPLQEMESDLRALAREIRSMTSSAREYLLTYLTEEFKK